MREFRLSRDHITLAAHMHVRWGPDRHPWGAPEVNQKRPYGNGDPAADVIRILGWKVGEVHDDELRDRAEELHEQMETAVQVILRNAGTVKPGLYHQVNPHDPRSWVRLAD